MKKEKIVIDLHFLGSIAYYQKILKYKEVIFEAKEHFVRASYRNRCEISGPNGKSRLSIQIKGGRKKRLYSDVEIAYEHNWHKIHWHTLESNYRSSPYFEFYEDYFQPFFTKKHDKLFDFNLELFQLINQLLSLNIKYSFTDKFEKNISTDADDYRGFLMPNKAAKDYRETEYIQVFSTKNGFFSNLSIIDLLYCEGPNAINFLK